MSNIGSSSPYREPMPPCKECDGLTQKVQKLRNTIKSLEAKIASANYTIENMKGTRMLSSRAYISFAIVAFSILFPIFVGGQLGVNGFAFITSIVFSMLAMLHELIISIKRID